MYVPSRSKVDEVVGGSCYFQFRHVAGNVRSQKSLLPVTGAKSVLALTVFRNLEDQGNTEDPLISYQE